MEQEHIPDFLQEYYAGTTNSGKDEITRIAKEYGDEKQLFLQTTYVEKVEFQRLWNKTTGDKKKLSPEEALKPLQYKYSAIAKAKAQEHGYTPTKKQNDSRMPSEQPTRKVENKLNNSQQAEKQQFLNTLKTMKQNFSGPKPH